MVRANRVSGQPASLKPPGIPPSQRKHQRKEPTPDLLKLWDEHPSERLEFVRKLPQSFHITLCAAGLSDDAIRTALLFPFAHYLGYSEGRLGKDVYDLTANEPTEFVPGIFSNAFSRILERSKTDLRWKFDVDALAVDESVVGKFLQVLNTYAKENGWKGPPLEYLPDGGLAGEFVKGGL